VFPINFLVVTSFEKFIKIKVNVVQKMCEPT